MEEDSAAASYSGLLATTTTRTGQGGGNTSVNQNADSTEQLRVNNGSHAHGKMSEAANGHRRSYVVIIAVLVALYVVSMAACFRRVWKERMHRLQQMKRQYWRSDQEKVDVSSERGDVGVKEGAGTVGHWNAERFDEMLENAEVVQDVIVDDIVEEMETDGREQQEGKPEMHVLDDLDPVDEEDHVTPF